MDPVIGSAEWMRREMKAEDAPKPTDVLRQKPHYLRIPADGQLTMAQCQQMQAAQQAHDLADYDRGVAAHLARQQQAQYLAGVAGSQPSQQRVEANQQQSAGQQWRAQSEYWTRQLQEAREDVLDRDATIAMLHQHIALRIQAQPEPDAETLLIRLRDLIAEDELGETALRGLILACQQSIGRHDKARKLHRACSV